MIVLGAPRLGFHGGVERHVFDLAAGLRARGHRVALAYGADEGREPTVFAGAFDEVAPMGRAKALLRDAAAVYVHKIESPELFDAVPSSTPLFFAAHDHDLTCVRQHRYLPVTTEPCSRPPGLSCVAHGCVLVRSPGSRLGVTLRDPFALARSTRALARRAHLVACSAFVRRTLLDAGVPADRVTVVNPVPPEDTAALVEPPTAPILGFVGQIIRGKGLDLLLRALVALPDATLVVAGGGKSLEAEQARARELGVASRVEFLGAISPSQVRAVYDRIRVLVVPSRWPEPFGMIGVEAMRRGRVTVGARIGGIPEWLDDGETGFAFRAGDVDDLVVAIRAALSPTRYAAMARVARERATTRLSFAGMMDRIESVLAPARRG